MVKFSMAKNAEKPPLTMVDPAATGVPPPRKLGTTACRCGTRCRTPTGSTMPAGSSCWPNAVPLQDRVEALAARISTDGEVVNTRAGPKAHPACGTSWPDAPSSSGPSSGSGWTSEPSSRVAGRRRDGEGPMPTDGRRVRHSHRGRLNHGQDMMLAVRPRRALGRCVRSRQSTGTRGCAIATACSRWYRHGRRPQAWWQFGWRLRYQVTTASNRPCSRWTTGGGRARGTGRLFA